jgi:hypothetical protein
MENPIFIQVCKRVTLSREQSQQEQAPKLRGIVVPVHVEVPEVTVPIDGVCKRMTHFLQSSVKS